MSLLPALLYLRGVPFQYQRGGELWFAGSIAWKRHFEAFCRRKQGRRKLACDIPIVSSDSTRIARSRRNYLGEWAERRAIFAKSASANSREPILANGTGQYLPGKEMASALSTPRNNRNLRFADAL
jgi:hypothetical protein